MKRSADWIEMFGCDELEPLQKEAPALPLDDPFFLELVTDVRSEGIEDDSFIKEISGCDWQPITVPKAAPMTEFTKRATSKGLTRQQLADRMSKYYRHGIWRQWERMMTACIGDTEFSEQKALSYLEAA
jgi:hypothetical protein